MHRDYEHALDMASILKTELNSVDVFLLMFHGGNQRFLASITKLLKLYESIFSKDLWKHAITEMTYWKWDTESVENIVKSLESRLAKFQLFSWILYFQCSAKIKETNANYAVNLKL